MARILKSLSPLWALALTLAAPCVVADTYPDTAVKAAFVLRFAGYVEWPPHAAPQRELVIAVYGNDDMVESLQRVAADRLLQGRTVQVRKATSLGDARGAQILYVDGRHQRRLRTARETLADSGVLIVTDGPQGLASGSVISFLLADNRVRFEVALDAARKAGLRISPELLSLAVRVTE